MPAPKRRHSQFLFFSDAIELSPAIRESARLPGLIHLSSKVDSGNRSRLFATMKNLRRRHYAKTSRLRNLRSVHEGRHSTCRFCIAPADKVFQMDIWHRRMTGPCPCRAMSRTTNKHTAHLLEQANTLVNCCRASRVI